MDFTELGFVPVAAIVVLCLLLGKAWKTADRLDNIWEPPVRGTIANKNTKTPIPPIQLVKLRQKSEL